MMETDELAADIGTVIDGIKAVDIGLIDSVGGLNDAMSALKEMIKQNKKSKPKPKGSRTGSAEK